MSSNLFKSFHSIIKNENRLNKSSKIEKDKLSYSMFVDKKSETTLKTVDSFDSFDKLNEKLSKNKIETDNESLTSNNVLCLEPRKVYSWIEDKTVSNCYNCNCKFSLFNRKHHCRSCGKIFCNVCTNYETDIPDYIDIPKPSHNIFSYIKTINPLKNEKRVCKECLNSIKKTKKIKRLIDTFSLIDLNIIDYYQLRCVSKQWHNLSTHYLSTFRQLQYTMTDHIYTPFEFKMLINNFQYIIGHSNYILSLIKAIHQYSSNLSNKEYVTVKKDIEQFVNLLEIHHKQNTKPKLKCWNMMCSRTCCFQLSPGNLLECFSLDIKNKNIAKYLVDRFNEIPDIYYQFFMTNLVNYLNFDVLKQYLFPLLVSKSQNNLKIANCFIWNLQIQNHDEDMETFYGLLDNELRQKLKKTFILMNNLVNIVENDTEFKTKYESIIPIKYPLYCYGINKHKTCIKNSYNKPTIIQLKVKDTLENKTNLSIMHKKEDIRKDVIVMNIIKTMDYILKQNGLDLNIITYNILPNSDNDGFIEIVPNSKTINEIYKSDFTIQNYIMENNKNSRIQDLRKRFTLSCAAYCVISYLLGIGDRHLDNIMITQSGLLFHIDFGFIMGNDAKILASEIRITPDMIDAMGGVKSDNFKLFKKICTKTYNCLRRYVNLFITMLSCLNTMKPSIDNNRYTQEYIKNQILSRFIPGENNQQAKLIFITKVNNNRQSSYSNMIIDFCHKNNEATLMSSFTNNLIYRHISKIANISNWFYS